MDNSEIGINIKDFTLKSFTEAKALSEGLERIQYDFAGRDRITNDEHGQENCTGLIYPFANSKIFKTSIKNYEKLVESNVENTHSKTITKISLNVENLEIQWQPGDTVAILPRNSDEDVQLLLKYLELHDVADSVCSAVSKSSNKKKLNLTHIPSPSTPRQILSDCLNIRAILKKQFLSSLGDYCTDNDERLFLKCLSSKEGASIYNKFIVEKQWTLLHFLKICVSCKPPLNFLMEHLPRLLPRPYSIANSPLANPNEITLIFSTLVHSTPGVTTSMLSKKLTESNPSILMYMRQKNAFRYTQEDYGKNQICIAIGTGLAPFLGFLQHKEEIKRQGLLTNEIPGKTWIFVGATSEDTVIHRKQLLQWQSLNILDKFVEANSRSPSNPYKYVQNAMEHYALDIFGLLMESNTILYLCADGGGEITKCIEASLVNIIQKGLNLTELEPALEMLKDFKASGKYKLDQWL
ncbi:methionine synthase reductase [Haematobia irritans]|uniref:methionine synthase reductase n=1 Tax=Haematobia irritans TaxID=7368 RepID=UPI003F4F697D